MARNLLLALCLILFSATPAMADAFTSDRIAVTVEGSGPDVILIPGLTSSPSAWKASAAAMPGYRYHFVQVKGFAGVPAEANAEGKVAAPVAEEIARYIREQDLDKPAVIGHSMGGTIGLMIAARHPQALSRLMVVDQLPFMGAIFGPPGTTATSIRPTADALVGQMRAATPEQRAQQLQAMATGMVRDDAQRALVLADAEASDRETVLNAYHELIVTDLGPELSDIAAPTTVLYVTPAGVPFTDAHIDAFYAAVYAPLAGVELVRVPDSAHFVMSDNPAFFQRETEAFLGN